MGKRFTYKAATATQELERLQRRLQRARSLVNRLEADERNFKGFLVDFYTPGKTWVEYPDGPPLQVMLSTFDQMHLNQEKAKAIIVKAGKQVPYLRSVVTKLKVTKSRE